MPEILSPAGGHDSVIAAVRSGADAVYLGLRSFSARAGAKNFSPAELAETAQYCRARGVKTYLAINTLVFPGEWRELEKIAEAAANAAVDAVILQDLGAFRFFRESLPGVPLHASTQTSVVSVEGVAMLEQLGASRAVLGRELSFKEIEAIRAKTKMELEVFVHGALCVSVSGQCLFSAFLGGRSGNRGLCAGTCRLPFFQSGSSAQKEEYALSLKDLSALEMIQKLKMAGIDCFKIEGRMKRPEYVAAATCAVRLASEGAEYEEIAALLRDEFSRGGFTNGYLEGNLDKKMFGFRSSGDAAASKAAHPKIHNLYRRERQSVPVHMTLTARHGEELCLTIRDVDGHCITKKGSFPQMALGAGSSSEQLSGRLTRLGTTPFFAQSVTIDADNEIFVPTGEVSALRETAAAALMKAREKRTPHRKVPFCPVPQKANEKKKPEYFLIIDSLSELPDSVFETAAKIFMPPGEALKARKQKPEICEKIGLLMPRLVFSDFRKTSLLKTLQTAAEAGIRFASADNLNMLGLLNDFPFEITATGGMNIANGEAAAELFRLGATEAVLSCEISPFANDLLKNRTGLRLGMTVLQQTPLMLLRACPLNRIRCRGENANCSVKNGKLIDRRGEIFKIRCSDEYSEILNNRPLFLGIAKSDISKADFFLFDFRGMDEKQILYERFLSDKSPPGRYTKGPQVSNISKG